MPLPVVPAPFDPVPRKYRHDGWTDERQRAFIDALAETGSVRHAAHRINMSPEDAYYLRRQPGAESFRAAWAAALDHGVQSLADLAIDRARDGVAVPVYSYGKLVGERRVYNDRLLMFCVKHGLGRLGVSDPRPLGSGTKSPETRTREEAERHAAFLDDHREELTALIKETADALDDLGQALRACLLREAQAREAGRFDLEDGYGEQVAHLLHVLRKGPVAWKFEHDWTSAITGNERTAPFEHRPDFGRGPALMPGPNYQERTKARADAARQITEARAMWTAATSEASWAAWVGAGAETRPTANNHRF